MDETGSKVQFKGDDSYYLIYLLKRDSYSVASIIFFKFD